MYRTGRRRRRARLAERTSNFEQDYRVLNARASRDVAVSDDPVRRVDVLLDSTRPSVASHGALLIAWLGGAVHHVVYEEGLPFKPSRAWTRIRATCDGSDAWSGSPIRTHCPLCPLGRMHCCRRLIGRTLLSPTVAAATRSEDVSDPIELVGLLQPVWILVDRGLVTIDSEVTRLLVTLASTRLLLGDRAEARAVARRLLAETSANGDAVDPKLLEIVDRAGVAPEIEMPPSALVGLEARARYLALRLRSSPVRTAVLADIEELLVDLDTLPPSSSQDDWRLLLGHRLSLIGETALASAVLRSLLVRPEHDEARGLAETVLHTSGPAGDLRLQLEAAIDRLEHLDDQSAPEDRWAVLDAASDLAGQLGDWGHAVDFGFRADAATTRRWAQSIPTY